MGKDSEKEWINVYVSLNRFTVPVLLILYCKSTIVAVVYLPSRVRIFATAWTAARQASLSFTLSWSLLKLVSIESVMPSQSTVLQKKKENKLIWIKSKSVWYKKKKSPVSGYSHILKYWGSGLQHVSLGVTMQSLTTGLSIKLVWGRTKMSAQAGLEYLGWIWSIRELLGFPSLRGYSSNSLQE